MLVGGYKQSLGEDGVGHYDDQTLERAMSVFDRIVGLDSRKSPAVQK